MKKSIEPFELTLTQKDIYFDQLHHRGSALYNIGGYIRCSAVDVARMCQAHRDVVLNHDAFGIRIVQHGDDVRQSISTQRTVDLPYLDFSDRSDPQKSAIQWMDGVFQTPMKIQNSELAKTWLVKINADTYWYVALSHHLAMDGWGFSNWAYKVAEYYNSEKVNEGLDETGSWQSIVAKDQHYGQSKRYQSDKAFWLEHCKQLSEKLSEKLPEKLLTSHYLSDFDDPNQIPSSRYRVTLTRDVFDRYILAAQAMGAGVPQLFLAMLTTYFAMTHERDSIVFGIPAHNRKNFLQKRMVGVFTSVSPMQVVVDKSASFTTMVQQITQLQKASFRHQSFPIGHLMQALGVSGEHESLYDVSFNYLKLDYSQLAFDGVAADVVYHTHNRDKVPLTVTIWDGDSEDIELQLDHNHAYFSDDEIGLLANRFVHLLDVLIAPGNADKALSELPILPPQEISLLCHELNDTTLDYPRDQLVHQMFEAQVLRTPNSVAVMFGDEALTYDELNGLANRLAHYLREHGVNSEVIVGLAIERSLDMLVALLAVLKAGGAYVSLDPQYPQSRLEYMCQDSGLKFLLSNSSVSNTLNVSDDVSCLALDEPQTQQMLSQYSKDNLAAIETQSSDTLAYAIYTSGSTGKPKGVMIEHQNAVAFLHWANGYFCDEEMVCVLASTSLNFDLSTFELLAPLVRGGRCLIVDNILALVEHDHQDKGITLINSVPSGVTVVLKENRIPASVITVNMAGEALRKSLVNALHQVLSLKRVVNLYGPSEDTTYSTVMAMNEAVKGAVLIGKPINNTQAYVLTEQRQLAPMGLTGELYLGGDGLSRGYLNLPDVSAEVFINNPFSDDAEARLYKTGDLVRYLPDGNLAYLGRIDDQVKIRGFRVELGEIEHQLASCEGVALAVVVAREDEPGDKRLVAYVELKQSSTNTTTEDGEWVATLKQQILRNLPQYMLPSAFVFIRQWPHTPNGKIDKKALPAPDATLLQGDYIAPQTDAEQALTAIWANILDLDPDKISVTANFFSLGAHSLMVIRLVAEVRAKMAFELAIEQVFDTPNIRQMAALLCQADSTQGNSTQADKRPLRTAVTATTERDTLSFAQQRLWFIDQLDSGASAQYNMPGAFSLVGDFNVAAAEQAFATIISRHDILRTVYQKTEFGARPSVLADHTFAITRHDLTTLPALDKQARLRILIDQDAQQPFDISRDLMLRVAFVLLTKPDNAEQQGTLLFNMHHIASDGWSVDVLIGEFVTLYRAIIAGQKMPLPPLSIQYADYAHWQKQWLQGEVLSAQLDYWHKQLAELLPVHSLQLDRPRPAVKQHDGATVSGHLPAAVAQSLTQVAKRYQLTPFMLLQAALALMLSRHSNSTDIVIGTPVANRLQSELEPLIGFFVNTLVLRTDTSIDLLDDYFAHVRRQHLDAQSNQDVPFEQLVERLNLARSTAHTPLFQIMLSKNADLAFDQQVVSEQVGSEPVVGEQGASAHGLNLPGVTLKPLASQHIVAKFDLDIALAMSETGVFLNWTYDTALFDQSHIEQFNDHLCRLLVGIAELGEFCHVAVKDLPMLSLAQLDHLRFGANQARLDYPRDKCLHQLFEAQVEANPQASAVCCNGISYSYDELNRRANAVAHYLLENHQLKRQMLVGLCVERSFDMVVGLLAILKTGAAYVPLDPAYPKARIDYVQADANLAVILTQQVVLNELALDVSQAVCLDSDLFDDYPVVNVANVANVGLEPVVTSDDLAYVIYTSGSTGQPKGVAIRHRNANAMIHWANNAYNADELSSVLASTSLNFDLSVFELFTPLCFGYQCVVVKDAFALFEAGTGLVGISEISLVNTVPSAIDALLAQDAVPDSVRTINLAGEPLSAAIVNAIFAKTNATKVCNLYGPSEDTTYSTAMTFTGPVEDAPPIGKVIANSQGFVVSPTLALCPMGVVGELFLAGAGVTLGYLGKPELSAERYLDNPYYDSNDGDSSRLWYKTGDLVRYLPDGQLAYIGRIDDQVKIRGFRIELGEIEYQLKACDGVLSALVMAKEADAHSKQLVAYLVVESSLSDDDGAALIHSVRQSIAQSLPDYMRPSLFVLLEAWPLTPNGKIDKKALPEPDGRLLQGEYIAPQTATEITLVAIWSALLQQDADKISRTADFFALGGHSLLSIRLIWDIRQQLKVELAVKQIFEAPTIETLASAIDASVLRISESDGEVSSTPLITAALREKARENYEAELSFAQQRLWFIDQLDGGSPQYNMPAAVSVSGDFDVAAAEQALTRIINRHEVLRTIYVERDDGAVQQIRQAVDFTIVRHDLSSLTDQTATLDALMATDAKQAFDLSRDLMLRASFILLQPASQSLEQKAVLLFNMHHIASDGWSINVLLGEFVSHYQAVLQGKESVLPPLNIQYADYAQWQKAWLCDDVLSQQLDYWAQQLADVPPLHGIMADYPRPTVKQHVGGSVTSQLPAEVAAKLKGLAKQSHLTPFMLIHGALALVISRHSNSTDIVIGTPVANRMQAQLEPLIGFFVNTLVLRVDTGTTSLSTYLEQVKQVHLDAQSHQDVPFEQLVERLNCSRSTSHTPLFQIMLTMNADYDMNDGQAGDVVTLPGATLTPLTADILTAKFDLEIDINLNESGVSLQWTYDSAVFAESHVSEINSNLCRLLSGLAALDYSGNHAKVAVNDLPMLSSKQLDYLRVGANQARLDYPRDKCLHQLFEAQANANPQASAVYCNGISYSYDQLNRKANAVAHYLLENQLVDNHQLKRQMLVGLCVERSFDMVVGLLAILKTGAAYVPLDPAYPKARIDYVQADANLAVILTQQTVLNDLALDVSRAVCLDSDLFDDYPVVNVAQEGLNSDDLAYVIYTSGSTGQPKGVAIRHRNANAMVHWANNAYCADELNSVLASTSLNFDLSVFELFTPLCFGYQCVVVKDAFALFEAGTIGIDISLINTVPSAIEALLAQDAVPDSVRTINLAGEPLSATIVNAIFAKTRATKVCNLYGPSEDTTYSTAMTFTGPVEDAPPIGKVIANSQGFVLSPTLALCPVGVVGELYLAGAGVTLGYLGKPELSAERYLDNPYYDPSDDDSSRLWYKTGDLVRYLPDGQLAYIGRIDDQVKIRGFRIELGEIEYRLKACDGVESALVMAKETEAHSKQLVAYLLVASSLADDEGAALIHSVRQSIGQSLPDYMQPSLLVLLEAWPLTPNGKIDKKALPEPDDRLLQGEYVAPQTATEQLLTNNWAQLLKLDVDTLSVTANFFEIGGNSLLSTKMIHQCNRQYHLAIRIKDIFECPTIQALAARADHNAQGDDSKLIALQKEPVDGPVPLSFTQYRIWFVENLKGKTCEHNIPVGIKLVGKVNDELMSQALQSMIERHEILRTEIYLTDGQPFQRILPHSAALHSIDAFEFVDLSGVSGEGADVKVQAAVQARERLNAHDTQVFDIQKRPLMAAMLVKVSADQYLFHLNFHHIIFDGWSLTLFVNEFFALYDALVKDQVSPLEPLNVNYQDYSLFQTRFLDSDLAKQQDTFWRDYLHCSVEQVSLPFQRANDQVGAFDEGMVSSTIDAGLKTSLSGLAKSHRGSLFNVIHTALVLLIGRLSGEHDFNIGIPVTGRNIAGSENILGCFLNNLPIRSEIALTDSFETLLSAQIGNVERVLSNQDIPFERILEISGAQRAADSTPLFQIFLNMLSLPEVKQTNDAFTLSLDQVPDVGSKFNMTFYVTESAQGIDIVCNFNTRLFSSADMKRMLEQYVALLQQVADNSQQVCGNYALTLDGVNQADLSQSQTIEWQGPVHKCFEVAALAHGNKAALEFSGGHWSYAQLNTITDVVARQLIEAGVETGDVVGIMAQRSDSLVIATLATLKAGAAFMMLSNTVPELRLLQQVTEVPPKCLITLEHSARLGDKLQQFFDDKGCATVSVIADTFAHNKGIDAHVNGLADFTSREVEPHALVCIGFTSGTSGQPKAVMGRHSSLSIFMPWMAKAFDMSADDRFGMMSGLVHDPLQRDIFTPLCMGATLCIPRDADFNASHLNDWLHQSQISVLHLTPSLGTLLSDAITQPLASLRRGFFVGEALTTAHLKRFKKSAPLMQVINLYGSTETSRAVSYYQVTAQDVETDANKVLPVGKGIDGTELVIFNDVMQPCGIGEVGQIGIRSDHLSLGYGNDGALHDSRFILNALSGAPGDIIYLTGDLGAYRADGEIDCLGRIDKQVKIRGFRIELTEIEALLARHEAVHQVAVTTDTNSEGELFIAACLVIKDADKNINYARELRTWISRRLPDYMVPTHLVVVDEIPLTENGKLDGKALRVLFGQIEAREIEAPATAMEGELLVIWQTLLERQQICITDDFFTIGGHSLLATRLLSRLQSTYGVEMDYKEFFEDSSIRAVAQRIDTLLLAKNVIKTVKKKNKVVF